VEVVEHPRKIIKEQLLLMLLRTLVVEVEAKDHLPLELSNFQPLLL
jgi:hypothetical protein